MKIITFRIVIFLLFNIWMVSLSAQDHNPIDSIRNQINTGNPKTSQKIEWLLKIAEFHYFSNQNEDLNKVISEIKELANKKQDICYQADLGVIEAKYLYAMNRPEETKKKSNMVLDFAKENRCSDAEVNILLHMAYLNIRWKEDLSFVYIMQAIESARETGDSLLIAKANGGLGYLYLLKNQFQKSREVLLPAYKVFLRNDNILGAGVVLSDIAQTYYMESKYDSALFYSRMAEPFLKKGFGNYTLAINYNLMAIVYQSTGRLEEAINVYFQGLKIVEKYNMISLQNTFRYNLGNCYYSLNAKDKAIENYRLCLDLARTANDTSTIIYSLSALGNIALEDNKTDTANLYLQKSFDMALKLNDPYVLSFLASSIAELKIKQKEFVESQRFIDKAYEYSRISNSPEDLISINISQALLFAATKQFDKAIELLFSTLDDSEKINSSEGFRNGMNALAKVYEKHGDFKNALKYHQKIKKFEDSTKLTSTLEKFVNLELQFEQEKVERIRQLEIEKTKLEHDAKLRETRLITLLSLIAAVALLVISLFLYLLSKTRKKNNETLQEKNRLIISHSDELASLVSKLITLTEELEISNNTKSKLFSIIGHDLKDPFNIIHGYINLLLMEETDDETREIFYKRISKASDQLVEMINVLLEWAMAQSGTIEYLPELFDIAKATNHLIKTTKINADKKNIEIIKEYNQDQNQMIYADKNMFGRILHNLITNAIKFTPKNGSVFVGWKLEAEQIVFSVKDTGIGMSSEVADVIFEKSMEMIKQGTEGEKGTGLGLSICKEFVKKHNGRIWAESEPGKGSQFYFSFPINL